MPYPTSTTDRLRREATEWHTRMVEAEREHIARVEEIARRERHDAMTERKAREE